MKLDVLLSAMNLSDYRYIEKLNITGDCVVVNQCGREDYREIQDADGRRVKFISTVEHGLSKSRNMAVGNSDADICLLCDHDEKYVENYEELILQAFEQHPETDVIAFHVKRKERPKPTYSSPKVLNYLTILKVCSVEIAFRRKSVGKIHFNELFGAGSGKYQMGEENIFLYDCLRKGLTVRYLPVTIAELFEMESTWNRGFTKEFFVSRGANYYAMTKTWSHFLIWQFALRKMAAYRDSMGIASALRYMYRGREEMKRSRILIVGDYRSGSGPANVTKQIIEHMPYIHMYQKMKGKPARFLELLVKLPKAEKILCSGYSKQNLFCFEYARKHGKKSFYLMHGSAEYEGKINGEENKEKIDCEKRMLELTGCIIAVSQPFAQWLRRHYPQYAGKITYVTNGIDWDAMDIMPIKDKKNKEPEVKEKLRETARVNNRLVTVGGGMPRKRILNICKAVSVINELNKDTGEKRLELFVVGADGNDTEEIKKYSFVKYMGWQPHEETLCLLRSAKVFIQNSCFETFGLAPVEAMLCGCEVVISSVVGALDILRQLDDTKLSVIEDCEDIEEIAQKIAAVVKKKSVTADAMGITDKESECMYAVSVAKRIQELLEVCYK